ncbi:MAG TPA: hypothetical protein VL358_04555 [Caulobacteraceae bacterium]|jgi:hypothetical protein|nr:hypothetical protein [Caulobacteraceae bacterium]
MAGNATIGALRVQLGADTAQFESGLDRASNKLKKFGETAKVPDFGKALDKVFDSSRLKILDEGSARISVFGSALEELGPAGIAAGAGIAAVALALEGAAKAAEFGDAIDKAAQKAGVATDVLQAYRYAVKQLGGEAGDADIALQSFAQHFGAALDGISKKAIKPFEAIGLDPKAFGSTDEALQAVIAKIANLKSAASQADIADKMGLTSILPAIRAGGDEFNRMIDSARSLGVVMDREVVERAAKTKDKMEELDQIISVQLNSALVDLGPVLLGLLGMFAQMATKTDDIVEGFRKIEDRSDSAIKRQISALTEQNLLTTGPLLSPSPAQKTIRDDNEKRITELQAELARRHANDAPELPKGTGTVRNLAAEAEAAAARKAAEEAARKALQQQAASLQALDEATRGELSARLGLTKNLKAIADLQVEEVDAATKKANDKLTSDADEKKITAASARTAIALNNRAADEKKAQIASELEASILEQNAAQRQKIGGYYDQIAQLQSSLATTAEAQNRIELAALDRRQSEEVKNLQDAQGAERDRAKLDAAETKRLQTTQATETQLLADRQAVERQVAQRQAAARTVAEQNSLAEAGLNLQINLLSSQQALGVSTYAQGQVALKILALQQQLETLKQEEIINSTTASEAEKQNAAAQLALLPQIHANQTEALKRSNNLLNGMADAATALGDFAGSLKNGDLGGALGHFSTLLNDAAGLLGSGSKLGSTLSGIASVLGPAGAIVSGVGAAIGAIFSGEKTIGVVRLSAADQQKLQGVGTVLAGLGQQSASIANSLAAAEKYQNTDLEFSSQQVQSLKSISQNIGALTAALGRQISVSGDAFDTAKLGLGTTTSGSSGLMLLSALFGSKTTTTTLVDQGIDLSAGSLKAYIDKAVAANFYQDTQSVTQKSSFFGFVKSTTTRNNETTSPVGDDVATAISKVVASLRDGVLQAATTLGVDGAQQALDAFTVDIGRISLDGLSASQITDQLNAVFSKLGDELAADGVPGLTAFEQAGEGALETLERLATEYTAVDTSLASIGLTFRTTGFASVAARDQLVQLAGGLDAFTSEAAYFQQNFLTTAQQLAPMQAAVAAAMAALGESGVTTKAQFVALVDSLDVSTEAGAELYAKLMQIAPAFGKVADAAADQANKQAQLQIALMQAQGDASGALALQRKLELAATDDALKGLQQSVYDAQDATDKVSAARDALTASADAMKASLQGTVDQFQGFADSLTAFGKTLSVQTDNVGANYRQLSEAFDVLAAKARLGDTAALGGLQDAGQALLDVSKTSAHNSLEQARDVAKVKAAVEAAADTATRQVSIAQQQLDGVNATVEALGLVNNSVLELGQALSGYASALLAQKSAGGIGGVSSELGANPEVNAVLASVTGYTGAFGTGGFQSFITAADPATQTKAEAVLNAFGQSNRIVGFATGGSGVVGGSGAVDSQIIRMRATPGELVSVTHGDPMAANAEAMQAFADRLGSLEGLMGQVALNTAGSLNAATKTGVIVKTAGQSPADPLLVQSAA